MKITAKAYLARKPELIYTEKGVPIWKSSVAVQGRRKEDESLFMEVLAFNGLAEALGELDPGKGTYALLEGRLQTETYEGKEGKKTRLVLVLEAFAPLVRPKVSREATLEAEAKEGEPEEDLF
ncbi:MULTISPECIES: single-stranded DNA-binding protein [unclassified Thermus]|jgi:single-strand DNA-binding protein|uniref:single-stranded DNA-binding protein n=1 Tax=unclassified Thermus TaxID=2619321 RepID=UPI0003DBB636|nr:MULTISPECIES: single-stranded DNA-binding protein [unclassified Thermus]ETN89239.1 single-stranded DNA-binding protein [Thermus sp. NMX2.A1]MCS6869591.1 single-stranded DNA-binding protein [Thermus sp.]MCX7850184.1 single-stranded DNA-binding protein [Thermus sp.]MDW8017196.1 single-stranded DNA-binding protein [Thermus sp.]MDW8357636.1 single-stranded DNA-binding protein [Thermus sp.]